MMVTFLASLLVVAQERGCGWEFCIERLRIFLTKNFHHPMQLPGRIDNESVNAFFYLYRKQNDEVE